MTQRYIDLFQQEKAEKLAGDFVEVKVTYLDPLKSSNDRRMAINVDVFDAAGQVDGGRT